MAFEPRRFFDGVRYVGRVRAIRATYDVYDANRRYLLVSPSPRSGSSYFMTEVPRAYVDSVRRRFRAQVTTSTEVRKRLGGPAFRQLGSLIVLSAQRHAKITGRKGPSLAFRVRA